METVNLKSISEVIGLDTIYDEVERFFGRVEVQNFESSISELLDEPEPLSWSFEESILEMGLTLSEGLPYLEKVIPYRKLEKFKEFLYRKYDLI